MTYPQGTYPQGLPAQGAPQPQPPQRQPPKRRLKGWQLTLIIVGSIMVAGLLLLTMCTAGVYLIGSSAPTVGTTSQPYTEAPTDEPYTEPPTEEPSQETIIPKNSDWKVVVKIKSREGFGSAGDVVTLSTKPVYVGTEANYPKSGTGELYYKLKGTQEIYEDYFKIDFADETWEGTETIVVQTKVTGAKITAVVTDVSYELGG